MDDIVRTRWNSRAAQCDGKISFRSQRHASEAAKRRERRVVYRCPYCFDWHVGTPERREKKFSKRKKLVRLFLQSEWSNND
jgi:hypothetical protein